VVGAVRARGHAGSRREESLAEPAVKQHLLKLSMEHIATEPEAFQRRMLQDRERWGKLIRDRKISLD
jgi:hypothetical protein